MSCPLAEARAVLYVAQDVHARSFRVRLPRGSGWVIERGRSFYTRCGDLPDALAEAALSFVTQHFAAKISVPELDRAGVQLRKPLGSWMGQHWYFTDHARKDMTWLIQFLYDHGLTRPSSARPPRALSDEDEILHVRRDGRARKALCPVHGDRKPSLHLNPNHTVYCYGACNGLVGMWDYADVAADQRTWGTRDPQRPDEERDDEIPDEVIFHRFVDAETEQAARRVLGSRLRVVEGDGAEADEAGAPAPRPANHPPTLLDSVVDGEVDPGVSGLALHEAFSARSLAKAARAGSPGVHPVQKYIGHYKRRDWPKKASTTQRYLRGVGEPESQDVLRESARPLGLVLTKIKSWGGAQSYASSLDLIEVLRAAEVRCRSNKAEQAAVQTYEAGRALHRKNGWTWGRDAGIAGLEDQFVSTDHRSHTMLRKGKSIILPAVEGLEDVYPETIHTTFHPAGFESACTSWVAFDFDKIGIPSSPSDTEGEDEQEAREGGALSRVDQRGGRVQSKVRGKVVLGEHLAHGDRCLDAAGPLIQAFLGRFSKVFTGRFAILRTGPRGVQIAVELEHARWESADLWRDIHFVRLIDEVAVQMLSILRAQGCQGGHVDRSMFRAGHDMRRPGWRIDKEGRLFRARLIFSTP